jgi:hypothetical protein
MRRSARTIKSMLTDGSAASIFAIRDWFEPNTRNMLLVGAEKSAYPHKRLATRRCAQVAPGSTFLGLVAIGILLGPAVLRSRCAPRPLRAYLMSSAPLLSDGVGQPVQLDDGRLLATGPLLWIFSDHVAIWGTPRKAEEFLPQHINFFAVRFFFAFIGTRGGRLR